jgi:hypothetical protein
MRTFRRTQTAVRQLVRQIARLRVRRLWRGGMPETEWNVNYDQASVNRRDDKL